MNSRKRLAQREIIGFLSILDFCPHAFDQLKNRRSKNLESKFDLAGFLGENRRGVSATEDAGETGSEW